MTLSVVFSLAVILWEHLCTGVDVYDVNIVCEVLATVGCISCTDLLAEHRAPWQ